MAPIAALLSDWVLTALWPLIGKSATRLFSSALFAHAGLIIGFLTLSPWLARRGRWRRIVSPELRGRLFWIGFWGSGIPSVFYVTALTYTTPANAAILSQVEVIYSAALAAWLLRERIPWAQAAGIALVLSGTWLIVGHDLSSIRWKGDLLVLGTPWMFQISHVEAKRIPRDVDLITLTGGRLFYGMLSLFPISFLIMTHGFRWAWSPAGMELLLAQGIGLCCLNHLLWYTAIRGMDLSKATTILLSCPALTAALSWGFLHETPSVPQVAGLILTLCGAYWVSRLVMATHHAPPSAKEAEATYPGI